MRPPLEFQNPASEQPIPRVADAAVAIEGDETSLVVEVFAYDSCLDGRRSIGRLPGRKIYSHGLAAMPGTGRVFASDTDGMLELNLDGRAPVRVAGHPPESKESAYVWAVCPDAANDKLFALAFFEGANSGLAELDLTARRIARVVPLPPFPACLSVDARHRIVVLPRCASGPAVVDFDGRFLARLSDAVAELGDMGDAAVRADGLVAIGGTDAGLWLWDWRAGRASRLLERGSHPAWSPDGKTLYFRRTSAELWQLKDGEATPLVQLVSRRTLVDPKQHHGYCTAPHVSPDGRFVLCLLSTIDEVAHRHTAVVVETATGHVHQAPHFRSYALAWT